VHLKSNYTTEENNLYSKVDEVIHYIWDPIGISFEPEARNEYYSYLPEIYRLVKSNAPIEIIAKHLNKIQIENIGLPSNLEKCTEIANILLSWADYLGFNIT